MELEHPVYEDRRPDSRTLYAWLALWRIASRREHTLSGRLQLSSHICVLERGPFPCRTLRGVWPCCWDVRTVASWNSSKFLDIEEGLDGWCLDNWASGRDITSSWRIQGIRFFWLGIWAESSRNKALKMKTLKITESLIKRIITWKWFCPTECSQLQTNILTNI
jgi:hypothetical protein